MSLATIAGYAIRPPWRGLTAPTLHPTPAHHEPRQDAATAHTLRFDLACQRARRLHLGLVGDVAHDGVHARPKRPRALPLPPPVINADCPSRRVMVISYPIDLASNVTEGRPRSTPPRSWIGATLLGPYVRNQRHLDRRTEQERWPCRVAQSVGQHQAAGASVAGGDFRAIDIDWWRTIPLGADGICAMEINAYHRCFAGTGGAH